MAVPLQAMSPVAAAVLVLVGLVLLGLGVRDGWVALRHRTRRVAPVGELAADDGRVVVSGVARRAEATVTAPLSGRACLAYAWRTVEHREQRSLDGTVGTWGQPGRSGREAVPFLVEDWTGTVRVDPEGADVRLAEEWVRDPETVPEDRPRGLDHADDVLGVRAYDRRYYEGRLDEGEPVTVSGRVAPGGDRIVARQVGVSISGDGASITDATPAGSAARAARRAAVSAAAGLLVLGLVALLGLVPLS
ncbi:MAG: GIDE domain-containing protein [Haloferacaceae archaeon]